MPTVVRVVPHQLLPGFAAGLAEPTAILDIEVTGGGINRGAEKRLRAGITTWRPQEPFFGVADADWPHALLAPSGPLEESPADIVRLGEWIVAVTVAMQRWCREPVWKGRVLDANPQGVRIALPWRRTAVLDLAVGLASKLVPLWADPAPSHDAVEALRTHFTNALPALHSTGVRPTALRFVQAAMERGVPFRLQSGTAQMGWGTAALRMTGAVTGKTGMIAVELAASKFRTNQTLAEAGVPVPTCTMVTEFPQALQAANQIGWPVVVKPENRDRAEGVTIGVEDAKQLKRAFDVAAEAGNRHVIVERQIPGSSHRLLVVCGRLVAATRRDTALVVGDGRHSVSQLIDLANADPRRGVILTRLILDEDSLGELTRQNLTPESVPATDQVVTLRRLPDRNTGATHNDVLSAVHPDNREAAERAARIVGLDVTGIDFLTTAISRSWRETGGAICEVNTDPSFIPHFIANPEEDINGKVLDLLLEGRTGRVPAAAILGDDVAADTADLLHQIWTSTGVGAGCATERGVRVGDQLVTDRDGAGIAGAAMLVMDPVTEGMVIQLPAARLQKQGHPCDRYDVVAVPGPFDPTLAAEAFERASTLVLDAEAGWNHTANAILISREPQGAAVTGHRNAGGRAVVADDDGKRIRVVTGEQTNAVFDHVDGVATLASVAMAWALGLSLEAIEEALGTRHDG